MTLCFVADVHLGNPKQHGGPVFAGINRRGGHVLEALTRAVEVANQNDATLVSIGDLFDTTRPEAQLIASAQRILSQLKKRAVIILGNHEVVSTADGDNSLAPLAPIATIVEKPESIFFGNIQLVCVPFRPGPALEWLPDAIMAGVQGNTRTPGSPASSVKVLALHLGLLDDKTAPWLAQAHDAISVQTLQTLCEKHGISHVYAGNWHDRRTWAVGDIHMTQVGALHPTGWNNPGNDYGYVDIFKNKAGTPPSVVPGARFLEVTSAAEAKKLEKQAAGHIYLRSQCPEEKEAALFQVLEPLQAAGKLTAWEHRRSADVEEAASAKTALADARGASNEGRDAIAEYISALKLSEVVDKAKLLEKVRGYLT